MKLLFTFISLLLMSAAVHAETSRPNVIIFLIDDMGVMDTSVPFLSDKNGNPVKHPLNHYYKTPGMERLAAMGTRFETFYAHSVCSPSRATIITGQNSARHKTTQWIHPTKKNTGPENWNWEGPTQTSITLPRILQKNGYHTIHIGKAHFGPKKSVASDPKNIGFDINIAGSSIGRPKSYFGEKSYGKGDLRQPPHLEKYHGSKTFLTEALTLEAINSLKKNKASGKPFFLHFSHYAVHSPFHADPRFIKEYKDKTLPQHIGKTNPAFGSLVSGIDKSLNDLLNYLEQSQQAENTLIFFLGDNGSDAPINHPEKGKNSSAPLRHKKGSCYEGGLRVPFIAAWAKVNNKNSLQQKFPVAVNTYNSTSFASIEDLMPSILHLTGTPAPKKHIMDGVNILPALSDTNKKTGRTHFLNHFPHNHRSNNYTTFRQGNWKLILHRNENKVELFNLSKDPLESSNIAAQFPEKIAELKKHMQQKLDETGALYFR